MAAQRSAEGTRAAGFGEPCESTFRAREFRVALSFRLTRLLPGVGRVWRSGVLSWRAGWLFGTARRRLNFRAIVNP